MKSIEQTEKIQEKENKEKQKKKKEKKKNKKKTKQKKNYKKEREQRKKGRESLDVSPHAQDQSKRVLTKEASIWSLEHIMINNNS